MKISSKQYAKSLFEGLVGKKEEEQKEIIKNFSKILIDNNNISKLEEIIIYFNKFWNEDNKIAEAEIISARKINNEVLKELKNIINKETDSENIIIKEREDKSILGGVIVKYGDKSLDLSLKNKLNNFKKHLIN